MKKIFVSLMMIFAMGVSSIAVQASNNPAPQELSKKEQKELEKKQKAQKDSIAHAEAVKAIKDGAYILITERIFPLNVKVNNQVTNNFVIVDKDKITLQTGLDKAFGGNNHQGGITINASITGNVKVEEKKNGEVRVKFNVTDEYLTGKIDIKLDKKDNYGEITVLEMKTGTDVTFSGKIIPFSQSMVGSAIQVGKSFLPDPTQGFGKGGKSDTELIMKFLNGSKF